MPQVIPGVAQTHTSGYALVVEGRYVAAMDAFEAMQPKTAAIYNQLGIAAEHLYMAKRAEAYFQQAIHLSPRMSDAWNNLGTVYYGLRNYAKAERCYKKAIRLNGNNAFAAGNLGTLYFTEKKFKKGAKAYSRAFTLDHGVFTHAASNTIQSTAAYTGAAELNFNLARLFSQQGMPGSALDYLEKAVSEGFRDRRRLLKDPAFAGVQKEPRFLELVRQMRG